MKKCEIRNNIYVNLLQANGITGVESIRESVKEDKEIYKALNITNPFVDKEHTQDLKDTAKALKQIPEFKDNGILFTKTPSLFNELGAQFIDKLIVTKDQIAGAINGINKNGFPVMESLDNIYVEDGKYKSELTEEELNILATKFLDHGIDSTGTYNYFTKKEDEVIFSEEFMNDYNAILYANYQHKLGILADELIKGNANENLIEPEIKEAVRELRSKPILTHLSHKTNNLVQQIKEAKKKGNKKLATLYETQLIELKNKEASFQTSFTKADLILYLKSEVQLIDTALSLNTPLDSYTLDSMLKTSKMVKSIAEYRLRNPVLSVEEMYDEDFFDEIQAIGNEADRMYTQLMLRNNQFLLEEAERRGIQTGDTVSTVAKTKNLKNGFRVYLQNILGIHNIDNTAIGIIINAVDTAITKANSIATIANNEIASYYHSIGSGFNKEVFYQQDEDGVITGNLVDKFSTRYFEVLNSPARYKTRFRVQQTIALNPYILFELPDNNPEKIAHIKELTENAGEYTTNFYIERAKEAWDTYKNLEDSYRNSGNPGLDEWISENSPVERIKHYSNATTTANYRGKNVIKGSDAFLFYIPRKIVNGVNMGFYDTNFDAVEEDPNALKFYDLTRRTFLSNNKLLYGDFNVIYPPQLGFKHKNTLERIKSLDGKGLKKDFINEYTTSTVLQQVPKNIITGETGHYLASDLHTIRDEIRIRYKEATKNYGFPKDEAEAEELKKSMYKSVAEAVKAEMTDNFIHSVTLANYSTAALIEKKNVESIVNIAKASIESDLFPTDQNKVDEYRKTEKMVESQLRHYLNSQFYNKRDSDVPTFMRFLNKKEKIDSEDEEEEQIEKRKFTLDSIEKGFLSFGRVILLGWSSNTAIKNLGQAMFSAVIKSSEVSEYTLSTLARGYYDIFNPKYRSLIDRLYVLGDVAYLYDKSNLHNSTDIGRRIQPMYLQTAVEKINQGSVALGVFRNTKVINKETGEITDILSALDNEGMLSDKWESQEYKNVAGEDLMVKIVTDKIKPLNMQISGDYFSPLLVQRHTGGKLLMMFKKFIPEMVMDRVGEKRYDARLKREVQGRYRGAVTAVYKYAKGQHNGVSELELQNLRGTATEAILAFLFKFMVIGLRKLLCETNLCKEQKGIVNYSLNTLSDLSNDVLMFLWPETLAKSVLSPFAIEGTLTELGDLVYNFTALVVPGGDTGRYKQDTDFYKKGDAKVVKNLERLIPFYRTNIMRTKQLMNNLRYSASWVDEEEEVKMPAKTQEPSFLD